MGSLHSQVYQFGKLFQSCKAVVEDLFRAEKVIEFQREVTPQRVFVVAEVLEVHVTPSEDVRMVPESPTTTKVPFEQVTPERVFVVPEVLEVHVVPSEEVRMVPEAPTTTKVLFPYMTALSAYVVPEVLEQSPNHLSQNQLFRHYQPHRLIHA